MTIGIVDYGAGNLFSVKKAFDYLEVKSRVISEPAELSEVERLVLPGVGAFGPAMAALEERSFSAPLQTWLKTGRSFLGICLGLQLLFSTSEESPEDEGLGVIPGTCLKFVGAKVPQIGWNSVETRGVTPLFEKIRDGEFFYFVHSYYVKPEDQSVTLAVSDYGGDFTAAVGRDRMFAVQFHPEKSGRAGLQLLRNWVERC